MSGPKLIALETLACCLLMTSLGIAQEKKQITVTIATSTESEPPFEGSRASVDIALLLDTSNSMDGLISQAKNQLWTIVQQFAKAKKHGKMPRLRVALFEYGNTSLPATEGYIRQVMPLTDDLDQLSGALNSLSTNGGDEYCGQVILEALKRLDWSTQPNSYKAIFIAGNEPFTQGSVDYRDACRRAIESGVIVNTIHCGERNAGLMGKWKDGADIAEGKYFNIDQDRKMVHIDCPQDAIIIRLNSELNRTYLWFGDAERRRELGRRQYRADAGASNEGRSTETARIAAKASGQYSNRNRDLIDTFAAEPDALEQLDREQLPEVMQEMTAPQRAEHLRSLAARRKAIQSEIRELTKQREAHIAETSRANQPTASSTLGDAVVSAIREQLVAGGFSIEE